MSNKTWTVIHGYSGFPYTADCLKSFAKYPNIIWSSWKDTPQEIISLLEENKIPYVLSDYPPDSPSHFSWQVFGFNQGLKLAKQFGAQYIYKVRNDLDIINFDKLLDFLEQKIESGGKPINNICWDELCNGVCDYCMFGTAKEMEFYWDIPNEWSQKYGGYSERMVLAQYLQRKNLPYRYTYRSALNYIDTYIQDLKKLNVVINRFKWLEENPLDEHFSNRCIYK